MSNAYKARTARGRKLTGVRQTRREFNKHTVFIVDADASEEADETALEADSSLTGIPTSGNGWNLK